jgi:hypothetical protein
MKRALLASLLTLYAVSTLAETYVRVEKDGTKTYSDRPIPGGQPINLEPVPRSSDSPPPPAPAVSASLSREQQLLRQVDDFKYSSCALTPENGTTFQSPENVTITFATTPALRPGDISTLSFDGQPVGGPNAQTHTVSPVYRGTHTAAVTIRNSSGNVLCSASSSFHVLRPGLNSPARSRR